MIKGCRDVDTRSVGRYVGIEESLKSVWQRGGRGGALGPQDLIVHQDV